MRTLGVEVGHSDPLKPCSEVTLHPAHKATGQLIQVDAIAKLWRHDQFPEARVAGLLPPIEDLCRVATDIAGFEYRNPRDPGGALPGNVAAVCAPLARRGVPRIDDTDGATLITRPPRVLTADLECALQITTGGPRIA